MASEAEELPRTIVRRIVRATLLQSSGLRDVQVNKDALVALAEGAKIFIHYLAAAANEVCHEGKRQTISAADILTAVKDLGFGEFVPPLEAALEAHRRESRTKKSEAKTRSEGKKRKADIDAEGHASVAIAAEVEHTASDEGRHADEAEEVEVPEDADEVNTIIEGGEAEDGMVEEGGDGNLANDGNDVPPLTGTVSNEGADLNSHE